MATLLFHGLPCPGAEGRAAGDAPASEPQRSWVQTLVLRLHPDLRSLVARELELNQKLARLPIPEKGQRGEGFGFHSRLASSTNAQKWVQVDLGRTVPIDAVALIPAHVVYEDSGGPGYGFPLRFRIDLSEDPDFLLRETLLDHTQKDYPNPAYAPLFVPAAGLEGRYVRLTATRLARRRAHGLLALGELIVLEGKRNVAAGREVTASDVIEGPPLWSKANLVDNQSILGIPSEAEISEFNGYHSVEFETNRNAVKWVQVDLGAPFMLDEIRLIPARPVDWAHVGGFGFPVRFRVEISADETFERPEVVVDYTGEDYPNPGDNMVVIPVEGRLARHIRVTATRLWERTGDYAFALAELEAYSGDENVALGKTVTALESHEAGDWGMRHLVDGYSSQYRMGEFPSWLQALAERHEIEVQLGEVVVRKETLLSQLAGRIIQILGVSLALLLVGGGYGIWRHRAARHLQLIQIRNQIARDLHDEIGSNLGTIALLSQAAGDSLGPADATRNDLSEIRRIALETAQSMREIVWLINPRATSGELITRMRELANTMLKGTQHRFEVKGRSTHHRFSLDVRRNLFLILKETLHNVSKHSGAHQVEILIETGSGFRMRVKDDGCGFDMEQVKKGAGLENLRHRARVLGATLSIESSPGKGTTVELLLPG